MAEELKTDLYTALQHVQARYASLSAYAQTIINAQKAAPKGTPMDCKVIDTYHRAVNDHLSFGRKVFDLIKANKMHVEQVVYIGGKPATDSKGNVRTIRIDSPLKPPVFILNTSNCPNITKVSGDFGANRSDAEMGFIPILVIGAYALAGIVVVGVTGYVAIKVLKAIKAVFSSGPDYDPDKQVDAYVKCLQKAKENGLTPEQAMKGCGTQQGGALEVPKGGTNWGVVMVGLAAIGGGVYYFSQKGQGG
jgi:hypothetical protein